MNIGTITLTDATIIRNHYETAAWHTDIKVPAGTVLNVTYHPDRYATGFVSISTADGVIVKDHTPALFGGVRIAGSTQRDNTGKAGTARTQGVYPWELAKPVHGYPIDLNDSGKRLAAWIDAR